MFDTQKTKIILGKWSILALLLIFASPLLSNWFFSFISSTGTFGRYVTQFLSYLIFLWLGDYVLNKVMGLTQ